MKYRGNTEKIAIQLLVYGGREPALKTRNYENFFIFSEKKKIHIGMAENCYVKKKIISAWPRTAIGKKKSHRHGRELP